MVTKLQAPRQCAFTLIELLVVIAIIALLVSILMPALKNARDMAKTVACASLMKQWALAVTGYASENDDEIPAYAYTLNKATSGALDHDTMWYNLLSSYMGSANTDYDIKNGYSESRRCPAGRGRWGEKSAWIGVYYGYTDSKNAPFIFLNKWDGQTLKKVSSPVKLGSIRLPSEYLMLLDSWRDHVFSPLLWQWTMDVDGDGMNDSIGTTGLGLYNDARPKTHRGGCNITLFDGHVEWIDYDDFWEVDSNDYPTNRYWYNKYHP